MKKNLILLILIFLDLIWFILGAIFKNQYSFLISCGLILFAVISYFVIVYFIDDKNVLSLKALFTGMWLGTIGLSNLKLLGYQVPWHTETWLIFGGALLSFHIGFFIIENFGYPLYLKLGEKEDLLINRLHFPIQSSRLFTICIVVGLVGLLSFIANVAIKGYIPFFVTDNTAAYYEFYTRFNIFTVASIVCAGLCVYVLKVQKPGRFKSILLISIIIFEVILMPLLVVSRGTQMLAILVMTVPLVMLSKKKLLVFLCCMILAFGLYEVGSVARNYSNEYLDAIFQPTEVSLSLDKNDSDYENIDSGKGEGQVTSPDEFEQQDSIPSNDQGFTFKISPKLAFLYGYLTVSHDNFNEAVSHNVGCTTHGLYQLNPFTVILRFPILKEKINSLEFYQVDTALNTGNIITYAYYDFGSVGCCIFIMLWACVFSCIEQFAQRKKSPFSMLVLGVTVVPVVLCFFDCWMSNFTIWLLWGTVFLMYLGATLKRRKKTE